MSKGLSGKESRLLFDKILKDLKASAPNFELKDDPGWDELVSANNGNDDGKNPTGREKIKKTGWKPRDWLERQINAPVISFAQIMGHLGEENRRHKRGSRQSVRERDERRQMGSEEHKLLYKAIRGEITPGKHDFVRGRMVDSGLQEIASRSVMRGYRGTITEGANFDAQTETERVFIARDQYFSVFCSGGFEDEITGFIPWVVRGKPIYFAGRVDIVRHDGTVDGKFGEDELTEHSTFLTFTRDILVRRVRFEGIQQGTNGKSFMTNKPLLEFVPDIWGGNGHYIFYTDKIVSYQSVDYAKNAIRYHHLICEAVSEIADRMADSPELEEYFT